MAFVERSIEVTFKLASNSQTNQPNNFVATGADTQTIRNLRTSVRIQNSGSPSGSTATCNIWGLSPTTMNQLSTLGLAYNLVPLNTVTIRAGDVGKTPSIVFSGTILYGYANYDSMPDVPFTFLANSGLASAIAPADPSSFQGKTSVVDIMSGLARQRNLGFENNGVSGSLQSPYFPGNLLEQTQRCAEAAHIKAEVINGNTLAIWPEGSYRTSQTTVPTVSEADGSLIGAPAFTQGGIIFKCVFNPLISFGALVELKSNVLQGVIAAQSLANQNFRAPTNSRWAINKLDHELDAQTPGGQWRSIAAAWNPLGPKPVTK